MSDDEWGEPPSQRPDPTPDQASPGERGGAGSGNRRDRLRRQTRRPGRKDGGSDGKTTGEMPANSARASGEHQPSHAPDQSRDTKDKSSRQQKSRRSASQKNHSQKRGGSRDHKRDGLPPLYAALDLGTNNCRLLIATPQKPGRFRVVDAFSRIVRLGEGLGRSGSLSASAMDRSMEALKACANKLKQRDIRRLRLIATEACRQADNGADFLRRVKEEAGLELEIVDRETEARLAVAGCSSLIDREAKGVVLFDIGGGSSELALLDLRKRRRNDFGPSMISWTSLPVGVVTLSERHGGGKQVTREVFDAMVAEVSELLEDYNERDALAEAAAEGEIHLLGTSGTVTTIAGIHLELPRYDRRQVDGIWMGSRQVSLIVDQLVDMSFEERMRNPCIGRDRADLVLAGCAILVAIQNLWPYPRLRVADRGLREGLLTEMMNKDNVWRQYHGKRRNRGKRR